MADGPALQASIRHSCLLLHCRPARLQLGRGVRLSSIFLYVGRVRKCFPLGHPSLSLQLSLVPFWLYPQDDLVVAAWEKRGLVSCAVRVSWGRFGPLAINLAAQTSCSPFNFHLSAGAAAVSSGLLSHAVAAAREQDQLEQRARQPEDFPEPRPGHPATGIVGHSFGAQEMVVATSVPRKRGRKYQGSIHTKVSAQLLTGQHL
jgi:hypothetical protein